MIRLLACQFSRRFRHMLPLLALAGHTLSCPRVLSRLLLLPEFSITHTPVTLVGAPMVTTCFLQGRYILPRIHCSTLLRQQLCMLVVVELSLVIQPTFRTWVNILPPLSAARNHPLLLRVLQELMLSCPLNGRRHKLWLLQLQRVR